MGWGPPGRLVWVAGSYQRGVFKRSPSTMLPPDLSIYHCGTTLPSFEIKECLYVMIWKWIIFNNLEKIIISVGLRLHCGDRSDSYPYPRQKLWKGGISHRSLWSNSSRWIVGSSKLLLEFVVGKNGKCEFSDELKTEFCSPFGIYQPKLLPSSPIQAVCFIPMWCSSIFLGWYAVLNTRGGRIDVRKPWEELWWKGSHGS